MQKCRVDAASTGLANWSNQGSQASRGSLTGCHSARSVSCTRTPWLTSCLKNPRV